MTIKIFLKCSSFIPFPSHYSKENGKSDRKWNFMFTILSGNVSRCCFFPFINGNHEMANVE